jgi:hypothetical protein
MRTRRTHSTHQGLQKTPEIQQQIANDARIARMISNRIHSPIKKGRRRKSNPRQKRTSITPRRLAFGDEEKARQVQDVTNLEARLGGCVGDERKLGPSACKTAVTRSESAAVEHSHEHSEASSSGREKQEEATPRSSNKRLRSLFKATCSGLN